MHRKASQQESINFLVISILLISLYFKSFSYWFIYITLDVWIYEVWGDDQARHVR